MTTNRLPLALTIIGAILFLANIIFTFDLDNLGFWMRILTSVCIIGVGASAIWRNRKTK